ncbi:MAG: ECF transporter S component [Armatimonadetes bacterium]|nr:ECF transporter S component [Armatimonadota bacterium]
MNKKILTLTTGGLLSAVILLATYFSIPIPTGTGYVHLGDGAIFASAVLLGPFAAISAGLGSMLADLLTGFPHYMPATLVIKGLMGLVAGLAFRRFPHMKWTGQCLLFIVCALIMAGGYFVTEIYLYGLAAAIGSLPFNGLQGLAGVVAGLALVPLMRRIRIE